MVPAEMLFPSGTNPQMPEVYSLFSRCKSNNLPWWSGGQADQPYLLSLMFDACASGEAKYQNESKPYLLNLDNPKRNDQ